ncbi:zinc-ribbon domain-containing protein [Actinoplanes sp. NPDC024001]|uniref:zinc-ribbon domain-containing protein n=1 Tax=Actinoplanes sp. NPDC024001 TaxID=3154598 RepID=UPI0034011E2A
MKRHRETLNVTHPDVAAQWHPVANGTLTAAKVTAGSKKMVTWQCERGHSWEAIVQHRTRGIGCPYCSGKRPIVGETDLATVHPELAAEWHPTRNGTRTPTDVTPGSDYKAWWVARCGHEWRATVTNRRRGTGCPTCNAAIGPRSGKIRPGQYPQLENEWDPDRNAGKSLADYSAGSKYRAAWLCEHGHRYEARIQHRIKPVGAVAAGCPHCFGRYPVAGVNDLAHVAPDVAATWHPSKNENLRPDQIHAAANGSYWWQCEHGHEWRTQVFQRTVFKTGCPTCYGRLVEPGFNDLATLRPDLAKEWHPTKNGNLKPSEVGLSPATEAWWLGACGHEWSGPIARRTSAGRGCPECVLVQQSKIEREFFESLCEILTDAQHGARVEAPWGKRRTASVDILGTYESEAVVVEYDGSYWHAEKTDTDTEKTAALLSAGYTVIRIREQKQSGGLLPLPLNSANLLQVNYQWERAGEVDRVLGEISAWLVTRRSSRQPSGG